MIIDISDAVVLDKKSFKDKYLKLTIWQLSPFWKVFNSFFKQFKFPFSIWMLCTTFCLILPSVLREQQFEKFTDRQTDDGQCVIRKADLNLRFRWAKYQKNKKKNKRYFGSSISCYKRMVVFKKKWLHFTTIYLRGAFSVGISVHSTKFTITITCQFDQDCHKIPIQKKQKRMRISHNQMIIHFYHMIINFI